MTSVELGKRVGRIGFGIGFVCSFLFYASPPSWFTWESGYLCPWCAYIDPVGSTLHELQKGLTMGLLSGLLFSAIGFCGGYVVFICRNRSSVEIHGG